MPEPYWLLPGIITLWMVVWVYLGFRNGDVVIMQMRAVGAVLLAASVWLIWWLMDGVRYFT